MTDSQKSRIIKVYSICIICVSSLLIAGFLWFYFNKKYACNLYHYNIQFVPGDPEVEDNIISESMRGLLEMFEDHPSWKFSIEISGYGLEVMHDRHPKVFNLFKKLNVDTKQLELVLSPYSDQLSVAYPSHDVIKAIEVSFEIAESLDLKPSKVVFLQESQWLQDSYILEDFYDYFVARKEAFSYYHPDFEGNRVYSYTNSKGKEIKVIPADYFPNFDLTEAMTFTYIGDGEATNTDSYGNHFKLKKDEQKDYEETLMQLERGGFILSTIEEAAERSQARKIERTLNDYENVPDAFWSMDGCLGPYRWMGDNSNPKIMPEDYYDQEVICAENDGELLARNYRSRNFILMVEAVYNKYKEALGDANKTICRNLIEDAWRKLILGQVTDSTGWSPYWIEINYTLTKANESMNIANNALTIMKNNLTATEFNVSIYHDTVNETIDLIDKTPIQKKNAIYLPDINNTKDYNIEVKECNWYGFEFQDIKITLDISDEERFEIIFEKFGDQIEYSSALLENKIHTLNRNLYINDVIFAGANGFFYSEKKGIGIIKNCSQRHTACFFDGENLIYPEKGFNEDFISNYSTSEVTHQFFIYKGSANNALKLANMINSYPIRII